MEQRIGANSQPLEGAGFDPAFIPGLTSPASAEPADAKAAAEDANAADARPEETEQADAAEPAVAAGAGATEDDAAGDAAEDEESPSGPVFEAADRRARIVADHQGVRLSLDEEKCEFRWDEIGAVETEAPRFGKRFTITVHTPERRWYPIEIEATSRSRFKEWEEQLDEVLDAYFDDGAEDEAEAAQEAAAEDKAADEGEAEAEAGDKAVDETADKDEALRKE
ncbi:hypothetical protein ABT189_03660 [Streptomyces sp900105755]|uniref:hypothetical protein n=1 Tax=Streptomyces sp. 900105755 TaxID=3154389 RepID=UPI00332EC2A6